MHATRPAELLRIPEAAERLNVSRASVYRWVVEGRLPAVQLGGRGAPLRIPSAELERWLGRQMSTMGSGSFAGPAGSAMGRSSFVDDPAERRETPNSRGQSSSRQPAGEKQ
jgi:excisionase family DNA binding protein